VNKNAAGVSQFAIRKVQKCIRKVHFLFTYVKIRKLHFLFSQFAKCISYSRTNFSFQLR